MAKIREREKLSTTLHETTGCRTKAKYTAKHVCEDLGLRDRPASTTAGSVPWSRAQETHMWARSSAPPLPTEVTGSEVTDYFLLLMTTASSYHGYAAK